VEEVVIDGIGRWPRGAAPAPRFDREHGLANTLGVHFNNRRTLIKTVVVVRGTTVSQYVDATNYPFAV
jgi:hypothetical protein